MTRIQHPVLDSLISFSASISPFASPQLWLATEHIPLGLCTFSADSFTFRSFRHNKGSLACKKPKLTDNTHFSIYTSSTHPHWHLLLLNSSSSNTIGQNIYISRALPLQMGRQNSDSVAMHSSIALLQERFKQLQKVKEMREEKKLLRLFSETERISSTIRYEPSRLLLHPEMIIPTASQQVQSSLSYQPESQSNHARFQAVDTPLLMNLLPNDRSTMQRPDDSEVDTSLHL